MAEATTKTIEEPTSAVPAGGDDNNIPLEGLADPSSNLDASNALDDLLKQHGENAEPSEEEKKKKADADAAAAEKAKKDEADRQAALSEEEKKKEADAKATEAAKGEQKFEFESVELPPHSRPKSAEAFATVKEKARQQVLSVQKERDEWKTKAETTQQELAKRPTSGMTDAEKKEFEELRKFRQSMDVEADPSFKEWDAKAKANEAAIYTKLTGSGFTEEQIKKIKELGGPAEVDWDALEGKIPAQTMRYIQAKLIESESYVENKAQAIAKAKENAAEFLKTRSASVAGNFEELHKQTKTAVDASLAKMEWLKPKQVPAGAKPEEKAAIEKANAENAQVLADIEAAVTDDSAELRSALLVGYAQLKRERALKTESEAKSTAEIASLKAKVTELETKLSKIKGASTTRLRDSGAPAGGEVTKKTGDINEAGADALDRHLATIQAAKE